MLGAIVPIKRGDRREKAAYGAAGFCPPSSGISRGLRKGFSTFGRLNGF